MRFRRGRLSRRDTIIQNNAALTFYASCSHRPDAQANLEKILQPVPPKRDRVRRPVDGKLVKPSEYQEQGAVIDWWWKAHQSFGLPVFALYSVPNGAYLASGYIGAAMLKKAGMRKGAPDLVLDAARGPYHGLRIEMKSENGTESAEQQEFGRYLEGAGYHFLFCYGAAPAIAAIQEYLRLP